MKTLILAAILIIILLLLKLITSGRTKTIKEYWEGTEILKIKKRICYNIDVKRWVIEGQVIHYNINGTIEKELNYINDRLDGVQKYYDNNGKLLETIIYNNGTLITRIKQ